MPVFAHTSVLLLHVDTHYLSKWRFTCLSMIIFFVFHNHAVAPPTILEQPITVRVGVGQMATFTVVASGDGLTYQWFGPSGVALVDIPGKIAGATTASLRITNVESGDVGSYHVRVTNAGGSVNSASALLAAGVTRYRIFPQLSN